MRGRRMAGGCRPGGHSNFYPEGVRGKARVRSGRATVPQRGAGMSRLLDIGSREALEVKHHK